MLLRRLETYGFKSFADKTELEFDAGVTAIVGPNGSGKSNISDAIRWALGEQSIRTLRGSKTEDVIFAGSGKRRALGAAEVSLVFDNSDNTLPIDFNEVIITRRAFRSGDSEYYINKSPCRLKDIHELLADTGLGRDSMSVIGQNKVDEVLNSKPEERRSLFEEAAGITKYKNRKREAMRKMEETAANLNRVSDLIAEIESQLEPLATSAERTQKYLLLHKELTAYQATSLLNKLTKAEKMVTSAELEQETLVDREIAASAHLATTETEKERLTTDLVLIEEKLAVTEGAIAESNTELERVEGKKAVLEERIRQARRADERFLQELGRLGKQQNEITEKLSVDQESMQGKSTHQRILSEDLQRLIAENECISTDILQLTQQIETGKDQSFDQLQRLSNARNEMRAAERELERLAIRTANLEKEAHHYRDELAQNQIYGRQLVDERLTLDNSKTVLNESWQLLEDKKRNLVAYRQVASKDRQKLADQLQEAHSRLKILTHMQQDYEGFGKAIKHLLQSNQPWRKKICGAVAELLDVPEQYVIAIETALGGSLQHVATEDEETAKQAIAFLKSGNFGRATFLPLTTIKPVFPRDGEALAAKLPGALGFAAQLVECEAPYKRIRDYLLGRIIVVQDIEMALSIARKHAFSLRMVTLDGQQINPGGSLTGGSTQRRESSFFSRGNEIDNFKIRISDLSARLNVAKEREAELEQQHQMIEQQIETLRQERQDWEIRQAELTIALERVTSDCQRLQQALDTVLQELQTNQAERNMTQEQLAAVEQNISIYETRDGRNKSEVLLWQQQLSTIQEEREASASQITERKVTLAALNQQIEAVLARCIQYEQQLQALWHQAQEQQKELTATTAEIEISSAEMMQLEVAKEAVAEQKRLLQEQKQTQYTRKMELLAFVQKLERDLRDARRRHSDLQTRLHDMQLMATKYQFEIAHSQEQLEHMGLHREQLKELHRQGSPEELVAQIKKWEAEIAVLGPVNPSAIEEYERQAERYRFMSEQSNDLTAARDYLLSIIRDIDVTMSKQFIAAFAVINEKFGEVFARLFGGGTAILELINPDNVLETGIEISVQPPGKKQQSLSLLSGGERALTVIALLFSFLAFRPAPFCVVDEVDAALDEANVQRFSDFLRDYAQNTQFIVVTHRKGTMEAADVMQGVTMEESGVSRLLSVKFMDKAVC